MTTETLQSRLAPGAESRVYRVERAYRGQSRSLAWPKSRAGSIHLVDGSHVADKAGFLAAAGEALQFPKWAGRNWDAFEELVNDLSWLPQAPGHVLLIDRLGGFSDSEPKELRTLLDVLETAAENRRQSKATPLIVLLRGAGSAAKRFPAIEAGQS